MSFQENIAYHKTYHIHNIAFRLSVICLKLNSIHPRAASGALYRILWRRNSELNIECKVRDACKNHVSQSQSQNLLLWVVADILNAMRAILSHFTKLRASVEFCGRILFERIELLHLASAIEFFESNLIRLRAWLLMIWQPLWLCLLCWRSYLYLDISISFQGYETIIYHWYVWEESDIFYKY